MKEHRRSVDFYRLEYFVDEETIRSKYYVTGAGKSIYYLTWFRKKCEDGTYKRFADVWCAKNVSDELIKKLEKDKHKFPIRYND